MPSLRKLKQLQNLFGEIGHEKEMLEAEGFRPDSYPLPANEPTPLPEAQAAPETPPGPEAPPRPQAQPAATEPKTPEAADKTETAPSDDGSPIFEDLFSSLSDLITDVPSVDELPPPPDLMPEAETETEAEDAVSIDDFNPSVGEVEVEAEAEVETPENEAADASDIDFSGLDFPQTEAPETGGPEIAGIDDFKPSAGEDEGSGDFDLENLLQGFGETAPDGFDSDSIPSVSEISDEEISSLFPEAPPPQDLAAPTPEETLPEPPQPAQDAGLESPPKLESLPEIDDFLAPLDVPAAKAPMEIPDDASKDPVEAISLSEAELQQLLDTIASYPLNLRIACEKIIAEEIVEPALLAQFVEMLVRGGNAREAAVLAGKILKTKIALPKGYKTGEELEAEQSSFVYIFVNKFFPVIRISMLVAALAASVAYLSYEFIYRPVRADLIYKDGYERIEEGAYALGNRRFGEAFAVNPAKKWFYRYAELFRDERQYLYAEEKYDELLINYPRDKKGTLDYAALEVDYLQNYEKADRLVRVNILDYAPDDREGLLALGDVNFAWGEYDPSRYEEARLAYAKLLAAYGQTDPVMERMLLYLIRTDKLGEVIPVQNYFMNHTKSKISASSLAELGGYLLDKRFETVRGVPDEYIESIEGIKDVLLRASRQDFSLPEVHYHLARYYNNYGAELEERHTLEIAAAAFDTARPESPKRTRYRIDTQRRLARMMIADREFISAEEALAKGVRIMEDAVDRRLLPRRPEFGELYAYLGDLAYFTKAGDMQEAIDFYMSAEKSGWSPPEMQYRLGSAYYRMEDYAPALNRFFSVSMETPYNRRLLNSLGNAAYMRSDYFAAEGYFKRLLNMLESDRNRLPILLPHENPEHRDLVERMMIARNNLGVTYNALAARTGNPAYRARALGEFAESSRAWDALERNPDTLIRAGISDAAIPGTSLPYLNIQNTLYPAQNSAGLLFVQIDKDLPDDSWWEELMNKE